MSQRSKIEWTEMTWNPVRGCDKVSPGCKNCYAERHAKRFEGVPGNAYEQGFALRLVPEALDAPHRWRKPRRVFVNSMSDLFHESVPDWFIAKVFETMAETPRHTYQILTKRPQRMRAWFHEISEGSSPQDALEDLTGRYMVPGHMDRWPLLNVWLGVSVENQRYANERIPLLLETPAAVRFVSAEPLLGPIDLRAIGVEGDGRAYDSLATILRWLGQTVGENIPALDWVIAGAESGAGKRTRPAELDWFRALRDQCVNAGVPFFLKQFATRGGRKIQTPELDGQQWLQMPDMRSRQ